MKTLRFFSVAGFVLVLTSGLSAQNLPSLPAKPAAPPAPKTTTAQAASNSKPTNAIGSEPQATSAVYGDWVVRCTNNVGDAKLKACEAVQVLLDQNKATVAEIAVGRAPNTNKPNDEPLRLVVAIGNNVSFAVPIRMAADDKDLPIDLVYRRCLPNGCFADVIFSKDFEARWRPRTERGRLSFVDGGNREFVLPFSLRGFSQALDALQKS